MDLDEATGLREAKSGWLGCHAVVAAPKKMATAAARNIIFIQLTFVCECSCILVVV